MAFKPAPTVTYTIPRTSSSDNKVSEPGTTGGAGYAAAETVQEEIFDMIDREADGSDSLEVRR